MLPSCHNFSTDFGTVFVFASMEYWEYWGGNAVYLWALTSNWTPFEPIAYCDSEKHFWNLNCVRIYPGESVGWSVLSLVLSDFHCTVWLSITLGNSKVLKSKGQVLSQFLSKSDNSSSDWRTTVQQYWRTNILVLYFPKNEAFIVKKTERGFGKTSNVAHNYY